MHYILVPCFLLWASDLAGAKAHSIHRRQEGYVFPGGGMRSTECYSSLPMFLIFVSIF